MQVNAKDVLDVLKEKKLRLVSAESCTGGLIAASLTNIPGSSDVFERGYVTYSNQSKIECLGVRENTLKEYGAVSPQTAEQMAAGALKFSDADIAVSVTGIAGPDGGDKAKPVGTVYFGLATKTAVESYAYHFEGTRSNIREKSMFTALNIILDAVAED